MAFDGMVTKKIIAELSSTLIGGKVNKIFEPNKNEMIFSIYANGKNHLLNMVISSNAYRIHLSTNSKPNPMQAPNFCMLLRKHLVGYKITKISNVGLERIIFIDFEGYNELNDKVTKRLVIELMGKHSNIILLNEKSFIIDSLRHLDISSGSYRNILPANLYHMPPSDKLDFTNMTSEEFVLAIADSNSVLLENNTTSAENIVALPLTSLLPNLLTGISKTFVSYMLERFSIEDTCYSITDLLKCYQYMCNILQNMENVSTSCIFYHTDYTIAFESSSSFLQANLFLDDFYTQKEKQELFTQYRNTLLKLILENLKKLSKKLAGIDQKLEECKNMEQYRIYGELITSNLYQLNDSLRSSSIELENYYDNNNTITIPLDTTISPSYNAKKYFKKYHKLKNTQSIVSEQKEAICKELDYLESIAYSLENAQILDELNQIYEEMLENKLLQPKKTATASPKKAEQAVSPITYSIDGFTFYIGKNNKQNDYITTKLGKGEDLWFHVQDQRGSHCLLKCNGSTVDTSTIIQCAKLAAFYSKSNLSSNVAVDYCFVKNVKKPASSKPGMVIFTNYKTINVQPENIIKD